MKIYMQEFSIMFPTAEKLDEIQVADIAERLRIAGVITLKRYAASDDMTAMAKALNTPLGTPAPTPVSEHE